MTEELRSQTFPRQETPTPQLLHPERPCSSCGCWRKTTAVLRTRLPRPQLTARTVSPSFLGQKWTQRHYRMRRRTLTAGFFCAHHFCPKRKMFTFSRAHSHALTNAKRRHDYFRGLSRLLPVPALLMSILDLRFLGKMALLALRDWRSQPLKKPSQT